MGSTSPPTILYTDASDVPDRDPRYGLGGVLVVQHPKLQIEYFSTTPPVGVVEKWASRHTYMGQLELLACPLALLTWKHYLQRSQIIHFIDNDSAAAGLVRGYSPTTDPSPIIGEYWLIAAEWGMDIYIDRVESKSNLSDGPSRFDCSKLEALHSSSSTSCTVHFPLQSRLTTFDFRDRSAALPLVQSRGHHSNVGEERKVTLDSVGEMTSLAPLR